MKLLFLPVVVLFLVTPRLPADVPAPAAPTLAKAFAKVSLPASGVALAVNAEGVTLPPNTEPTGEPTTVPGVAAEYGLVAQDFGGVTSIAPADQMVLNDDPAEPNPYQDMAKGELLTLLTASLSDDQWKQMTGSEGLALAGLTGTDQRQMLAVLFPDARLRVYPRPGGSFQEQLAEVVAAQASKQPYSPRGLRDVSGDLSGARLRLGQQTAFMLPTSDHGYSGGASDSSGPRYSVFEDAQAYAFGAANPDPKMVFYGVQAAASAPNALKQSDLDYEDAPLQEPVPLGGLKTVADLVARIGGATHRELYADRRLEDRPLTLLGRDSSAPASGLLRALAFSLRATYRKVGPAYVLTEDRTGSGVIHQRWADLQTRVEAQKEKILEDVRQALSAHHSPRDLRGLGDAADLTPDQLDQALKPGGVFEGDASYPMGTLFAPLSRLTPGQQAAVRRMAAQMNETAQIAPGLGKPGDLGGKIMLTVTPAWQIVLPSLDGPVELGDLISVGNLFASDAPQAGPPPAPASTKSVPAPKPPVLAAVLANIPQRAVLAQPRTAQDVVALIGSMRTLGLNQLWLVTFAQGQEHGDVLTAALRSARGTGISVYAVLDLFAWGEKTPDSLRDRNVFAEDSRQADAHMKITEPGYMPSADGFGGDMPPPDQIIVNPDAPQVRKTLTKLVKDLAMLPGLAGVVLRAAEPPGSDPLANINGDDTDRRLGYTDEARLAFLRKTHVDPLDVAPNHFSLGIDALLWPGHEDSRDFALTEQWSKVPPIRNLALLRDLFAAVRAVAPAMPLLTRQRHDAEIPLGWYGSWDDPRLPLPTYHSPEDSRPPDAPAVSPPGRDVQAKAQSRTALDLIRCDRDYSAQNLADAIRYEVPGSRWDGFVLDFTQGPPGEGNPLTEVERGPTPSKLGALGRP